MESKRQCRESSQTVRTATGATGTEMATSSVALGDHGPKHD